MKESKGKQPGPGSYVAPIQNTKLDSKPHAAFVSAVTRDKEGSPINRSPAKKLRLGSKMNQTYQQTISQAVQDIIDDDSDDGTTPGPGAYYNPKQSTFQIKSKPERLQFFGSTVNRFQNQQVTASENRNLGPGSYLDLNKDSRSILSKPPSHPLRKTVGFNTGENRWAKSESLKDTVQDVVDGVPGPGSYQVPSVVDMI